MRKVYKKPYTQAYAVEALEFMLNVSGGTSNPIGGGDPTTGSTTSPNPFGSAPKSRVEPEDEW